MGSHVLTRREALACGLAAAALPLGLVGCAQRKPNSLVVGGLPVTCNLTLPVACASKAAANSAAAGAAISGDAASATATSAATTPAAAPSAAATSEAATSEGATSAGATSAGAATSAASASSAAPASAAAASSPRYEFEYAKYNGWPEIKESLMAGRIQAAYMLAPLVMDLADKGIPVKIVSLGHRSGAVIMVRNDSPYQHFRQLAGKRVAVPSRFAVDFLFLRRMLSQENMRVEEVEIVEMAPPDMPAALYANAVDAYCTGEPFGAAAQSAGYARPLRMTRDEWPKYICCVLTVREELIRDNPAMVQDLVNQVLGAGQWLDQGTVNREKAVQIAAGPGFFNQDPKIIRFVMQNPADRVTYGDLRMIRAEFEELMQLSMQAGTLTHPIPYEKYVDEQFALNARPAAIAL